MRLLSYAVLATTARSLSLTRRRVAAAVGAASAARVVVAAPALAADVVAGETVTAPDGTFSFLAPEGFEAKPKPVKTHAAEVLYKSPEKREIGVVVDRVTIAALEDFGTPAFVGEKVVASERNRDGVTAADLLETGKVERDGKTYYLLTYQNESSRGDYRFLSRVAVAGGRLYVLTLKAKRDDGDGARVLGAVADSFRVLS